MLRILYGTAGTGKSAAIMDEIRGGADSGERYILLVPEQYSHEAERELCAVCRREQLQDGSSATSYPDQYSAGYPSKYPLQGI